MTVTQPREPAGTPTGGQFAGKGHLDPAPSTRLDDTPSPSDLDDYAETLRAAGLNVTHADEDAYDGPGGTTEGWGMTFTLDDRVDVEVGWQDSKKADFVVIRDYNGGPSGVGFDPLAEFTNLPDRFGPDTLARTVSQWVDTHPESGVTRTAPGDGDAPFAVQPGKQGAEKVHIPGEGDTSTEMWDEVWASRTDDGNVRVTVSSTETMPVSRLAYTAFGVQQGDDYEGTPVEQVDRWLQDNADIIEEGMHDRTGLNYFMDEGEWPTMEAWGGMDTGSDTLTRQHVRDAIARTSEAFSYETLGDVLHGVTRTRRAEGPDGDRVREAAGRVATTVIGARRELSTLAGRGYANVDTVRNLTAVPDGDPAATADLKVVREWAEQAATEDNLPWEGATFDTWGVSHQAGQWQANVTRGPYRS